MITVSSGIESILKTSTSVQTNAGCIIEYNMNSMLDNIAVTYPESLDIKYKTHYNSDGTVVDRINQYRKLFPVDSVIRPFRPQESGVKYFIWTEGKTEVSENTFSSPQVLTYPSSQARVYFPGVSNDYKYWVTPINENADITVTYAVQTAKITEAYKNGSSVVYKTLFPHAFSVGQNVSISGLSAFNLSSVSISEIPDQYTFEVVNSATGSWISNQSGTATLASATKSAQANKIVVSFEKFHDKPSSANVYINGGAAVPLTIPSSGWTGKHTLYYNGTAWSSTQPTTYSSPISVTSIRVTATNSDSGKAIGITEISARWIRDISSDIVKLRINKESSANASSILPVGFITANNASVAFAKYNQDAQQILEYTRDMTIDTSKIYLYKNVKLLPYISIYDSSGVENKISQGAFYIKDWNLETYGEASVTALDGSKQLMETIAPELICESYPVTAVIRRLLDSIGFTNYNFNINENDDSIPVINYWYSTNSETVWSLLQDLCRDVQMNAFFDENDVLQFYSRNYIYGKLNVDWQFYYDNEVVGGTITGLANIKSITKDEIASANQVQVLWSSPVTSNYLGNSTILWQAPDSFLGAGGLRKSIEKDSSPSDTILEIDLNTYADSYSSAQTLYNFAGHLLIGGEIIEYDAIQYQYVPKNSGATQLVWIESATDLNKYRWLSKVGYADPNKPETAYFKPTGRYRVKTRGALGTPREFHAATTADYINNSSTPVAGKWNTRRLQFK